MRLTCVGSILIVMLATTLSTATAQSTAAKQDVVLELTLPNGAMPQLRISEGGTGSVELPDVGKFGFVPAFQNGSDRVVVAPGAPRGISPEAYRAGADRAGQ